MADIILFDEGANEILDNGYPSTVYFALSTKKVGTQAGGEHLQGDTLAGGFGEITGTGYARLSQAEPSAASRAKTFTQKSFATGAATNWPAAVRSIVAMTSSDNSGKLLWAQNLIAGGTARDMSQANTTENATTAHTLSP